MMIRSGVMIALALASIAGCKKDKSTGGGAGGGTGSGSVGGSGSGSDGSGSVAATPTTPISATWVTEAPADTVGLVGFAAGSRPDKDTLAAALVAFAGDDGKDMLARPATQALLTDCIVPLTAVLDRVTVILRGPKVDDDRVVIKATGKGLRGAFDACLGKIIERDGETMKVSSDGAFTLYGWGRNTIVAAWNGTDAVAVGPDRPLVESTLAKDGVAGTAFAKVLATVDTGSPAWFAITGAGFPPDVGVEWASGQVRGVEGTATAAFVDDKHAKDALSDVKEAVGKAVQVDLKGREIHSSGRLGSLLPYVTADGPDIDKAPPPPPLDDKHVTALVGAGPMVLAFLFVAGDSDQPAEPPPAIEVPAEPAPPPPVAPK